MQIIIAFLNAIELHLLSQFFHFFVYMYKDEQKAVIIVYKENNYYA